MYYHDKKLQYKVEVTKPDPQFARMLQQAIGGIEGEIRVALQYMFQAYGMRGPSKYRDMLLETATEELSHIEILATAVALNLEGAPSSLKDDAAEDKIVNAVLGGMDVRHIISSGLGAMATDANGNPFNGSWVVGTGNIVADMYANVAAEAGGRGLVARLKNFTTDPGMKDTLSFLLARDTMHQQQWLAVIEELGGNAKNLPIPNTVLDEPNVEKFSHAFISTNVDKKAPVPEGRWTSGPSLDGKGEYSILRAEPYGKEPKLSPLPAELGPQEAQMKGTGGTMGKIVDKMTGGNI